MPRGTRSRAAKQSDADALAALLGITTIKHDAIVQPTANQFYTEAPKPFTKIECPMCGNFFEATRANVSHCSDNCRQRALKKLGLLWHKGHWSVVNA